MSSHLSQTVSDSQLPSVRISVVGALVILFWRLGQVKATRWDFVGLSGSDVGSPALWRGGVRGEQGGGGRVGRPANGGTAGSGDPRRAVRACARARRLGDGGVSGAALGEFADDV